MPKGETIKDLYSEIRKCLFYMIPEKWESIYLYASVIQRDNGEETQEYNKKKSNKCVSNSTKIQSKRRRIYKTYR